jgi:hypothetical protein
MRPVRSQRVQNHRDSSDSAVAEHRVVLDRFAVAALELAELVGRRVECPNADRPRVEFLSDGPDTVGKFALVCLLAVVGDVPVGVLLVERIMCSVRSKPTPSAPEAAARLAASGIETLTFSSIAVIGLGWEGASEVSTGEFEEKFCGATPRPPRPRRRASRARHPAPVRSTRQCESDCLLPACAWHR